MDNKMNRREEGVARLQCPSKDITSAMHEMTCVQMSILAKIP